MPATAVEWLTQLDHDFERQFKDAHQGQPCLVMLRGPNVARDLNDFLIERQDYRKSVLVGVNSGGPKWLANYVVALDAHAFGGKSLAAWQFAHFVFPDTPPMRDLREVHPGSRITLWTEPPALPPGEERYNRQWPRPWGHGSYSSLVALWLAWYMGCNPIGCCGADFGFTDKVHGDDPEEEITPELAAHYRSILPENLYLWKLLVASIRAEGVKVDWPGGCP